MTSSSHPCTCPVPENVDLTEAYIIAHHDDKDKSMADLERPWISGCEQRLLNNLKQHGWSHLSVRLSKLPKNSPLGDENADQGEASANKSFQWKTAKQSILKLFETDTTGTPSLMIPNATYRTAESGSAGESTVEPKKSWESRRCNHYNNTESSSEAAQSPLDQVTIAMHSIICTVNWVLRLPSNLLLQEDPETYGCSCETNDKANHRGPCNMDLLRVFHYDKVEEESNILGSSPHTDWGTFTLVFQDDVGGLQTFCQACGAWRNIEAYDLEPDILRFVIHVGDATSLAMAHARQQVMEEGQSSFGQLFFPSPKHRVLSPVTEPRVSLVYFVYPAPGQSLESLAAGVTPWLENSQYEMDDAPNAASSERSKDGIRYDLYYLLHDQSADSSNNNTTQRSPKDVYTDIYKRPMDEVFAEKWQQVQRA